MTATERSAGVFALGAWRAVLFLVANPNRFNDGRSEQLSLIQVSLPTNRLGQIARLSEILYFPAVPNLASSHT